MRARGSLAVAWACVIAFLLLCGSAGAAPNWTSVQLPGAAAKVYLLGVSCPSQSLCVASGTNNLIATSTDPASGDWKFAYVGNGPWPETENWPTNAISGKQIQGISCPSSELCVGVTDQGDIYSSTDPTGSASAWATTQLDGPGVNTHLKSISCPTTGLCVAVTGGRNDSGEVWTSTDPTGGIGAWQVAELGEALDLRSVSCASASLCVAVGTHGEIVTSDNPAGGATAWVSLGAPGGPGSLQGITCRPGLCVVGNTGGNILASTAAGAGSWTASPGGGSVQITGSACPSVSQCVVVDNNGDIITSTQAGSASPDWSFDNFFPYTAAEGNALFAASCPKTTFCVLTGSRGQILTSTDPFAVPPAKGKGGGGTKQGSKHGSRGPKRPRAHLAHIRLKYPKPHEPPRVEVTVRFYARGHVRGYECRLDSGKFRGCRSPERYQVGGGHHYIRVRAVGTTGLRGPVAVEDFWIGRHHTGKHGSGSIGGCPFPPKPNPPPPCH
jgi:hypothetical protein